MSDVEPNIERLARAFVEGGGGNPDLLVQTGDPNIYGTPAGRAFAVMPGSETPLWRHYIPAARVALEIAKEQCTVIPMLKHG